MGNGLRYAFNWYIISDIIDLDIYIYFFIFTFIHSYVAVLFSNEKRLVSPETPSETGRRIFKSYDPEGNNFISSTLLRDVLAALNLVSEPG